MSSLPSDTVLLIFGFLEPEDHFLCSTTCRNWSDSYYSKITPTIEPKILLALTEELKLQFRELINSYNHDTNTLKKQIYDDYCQAYKDVKQKFCGPFYPGHPSPIQLIQGYKKHHDNSELSLEEPARSGVIENTTREQTNNTIVERQFLEAATFPKLIQLAARNSDSNELKDNVLLSYPCFTTKQQLLRYIMIEFDPIPDEGGYPIHYVDFEQTLNKHRHGAFLFLKRWFSKEYKHDWEQKELYQLLDEQGLVGRRLKHFPALLAELNQAAEDIFAPPTATTTTTTKPPKPVYPTARLFSSKADLKDLYSWSPLEIARQLTLITSAAIEKITPKELLNENWSKSKRETLAPALHAIVINFNNLSNNIGMDIVKLDSAEDRAKRIVFYLTVAKHCKELKNCNDVFAIMSGLSLAAVYRLKRTWAMLSKEEVELLEELREFASRERSFKTLRIAMKEAMQNPPGIPYIGILLTDCTFIHEGSPLTLYKHLLNVDKLRRIGELYPWLKRFSENKYLLKEVPELKAILAQYLAQPQQEEEMYKLSITLEPRPKRPIK